MDLSRDPLPAQGSQAAISRALIDAGLDLVHWFSVESCNARLTGAAKLAPVPPGVIGLLIGNSSALWPSFVEHLNSGAAIKGSDPLDRYVEAQVHLALTGNDTVYVAFAHQMDPAPIPIQQYAAASGFALMGPAGLSIHPQLGPWFALRAVVLIQMRSNQAFVRAESPGTSPCADCSAPCRLPFDAAMLSLKTAPHTAVKRRFLPARDACPVGREHRYSEAQIAYHYDGEYPIQLSAD